MSDLDEDTGYLVIKPGDRVFIEYDDPRITEAHGGLATVLYVMSKWQAKLLRDNGDGLPGSYGRHLLRKP